jgi:hypothetical protein
VLALNVPSEFDGGPIDMKSSFGYDFRIPLMSFNKLKQWVEEGKLHPQIAGTYLFTEEGVMKGFDDLRSRSIQGKCVVQIASIFREESIRDSSHS